jgi:hypothetical protein
MSIINRRLNERSNTSINRFNEGKEKGEKGSIFRSVSHGFPKGYVTYIYGSKKVRKIQAKQKKPHLSTY